MTGYLGDCTEVGQQSCTESAAAAAAIDDSYDVGNSPASQHDDLV